MPTTPAEPDNMMADLQSVVSKMREPAAETYVEPDAAERLKWELDEADAKRGLTEAAAEVPETEAAPKAGDDRPRREDGTFAPKPKDAPAAKAKAPEVVAKPKLAAVPKPPDGTLTDPKPETPAAPVVPTTKAPTNWRPEVREKWASLPPDVQAEINRREREISIGLGASATTKAEAEKWRQTQAPFEMMLRADGVDGPTKYAGYLRMEAGLRTGPMATKAGIVANIIKSFGVDIDHLAHALGGPAPDGTQTPQHVAAQPGAYQDPRVDQLIATLQHQAQERQAQQEREAQASLAKIQETNEFFEDLRQDAADFYEAAAKRGKPITLERAFELAAHANPEVSKVQAQRKAAEDAKAKAAEAQKKRAAASSIRSVPGGAAPAEDSETDGSLRGDLESVARRLASR